MKTELKLFSTQCPRKGYEEFVDFYAVLVSGEQREVVKVKTVFYRDEARLQKMSQPIESIDNLEKYL